MKKLILPILSLLILILTTGVFALVITDHTFCSTDNGYTSYAVHNTTLCALVENTDWDSDIVSSDLDLTNFTSGYNITIKFRHKNTTNTKIWCNTDSASRTGSCRYNIESFNTSHNHFKFDSGGFSATPPFPMDTNITISIFVNLTSTANKTQACAIGYGCTNLETFTNDNKDYIAFDTGDLTDYERYFQVTLNNLIESGSSFADESAGDTAIGIGVQNALLGSYTNYTSQQVYGRNLANSQFLGTFDWMAKRGNKVWLFNYITSGESHVSNTFNLTPSVYVSQMANLTSSQITLEVEKLINSTR